MTGLWFKRSVALGQDPDMQAAAVKHGGIAIVVFEELMALSKITRGAGEVVTTWDVLALRCYTPARTIKQIVATLERNHLVAVDDLDGDEVLVTIAGWAKWNPKDATNADRQARYRARRNEPSNGPRNGSRNGRSNAGAVDVTVPEEEKEKESRTQASTTYEPKGENVVDLRGRGVA